MKTKLFSFSAFGAILLLSASMFTSCSKEVTTPDNQESTLKATGKITWNLVKVSNPTADQKDAYAKITTAMNAAVARYNKWGNWGRVLTVRYTPGVPTAQASINGSIDFGTDRQYMTECTAMHEMGHCFGIGTAAKWSAPLIVNNVFVGAKTAALIKTFDGSSAVIHTDSQHFWPYGLNYNSEWSTTNGDRHARINRAMNDDGL